MLEKENQAKLLSLFSEAQNAIIYLKGGSVIHRYDTDFEYPFRQESNFWYLTGITEPDFQLILDLEDKTYLLVIPRRSASYSVWMGYVHSENYYYENFAPDRIIYNDQVESYLKRRKPELVYCLNQGQAESIKSQNLEVNTETLPEALGYCRSIKTEAEISKLTMASKIASEAHILCMESLQPGMFEYEMKSIYDAYNTQHGLVHPPYNGIHAGGANSAILHYVLNSSVIRDGDMYLIDAGSEYEGYASDISRTYPANGKFTPEQAGLYDIALQALDECIAGIRPGVKMEDLHLHACKVILDGLKDFGLLKGNTSDLLENNIFALFFPHGLGHFLGLDTHDVGGYLKGTSKIDRPGLRFLRARRTLEEGMVLTIEPGIYFIPSLLQPAFDDKNKSSFLCIDKIKPFMKFGGIRIEDNILVTGDGHINLTHVPKTRKDIEEVMAR